MICTYYRGLYLSLRYAIDYDREHCRWLTVTKYVYLFIQATVTVHQSNAKHTSVVVAQKIVSVDDALEFELSFSCHIDSTWPIFSALQTHKMVGLVSKSIR